MSKRKLAGMSFAPAPAVHSSDAPGPAPEDDLRITMLGAGQEVGRSCCVIQYRGLTVVCDSGVHPAFTGMAALPFIDELDWSTVDCLLITHFHLDHAAALTYIMEKTNFKDGKGKVYMTHPTKAVYRFLMQDYVRLSNAGADDQLFDESQMLVSWRQIEAVDYHQDISVRGGLRFTPYHAGHVLGACMFLIEIAGLRVLYTGDYSREEDRHLVQAEVPPVRPDVLICESTYGTQNLVPRLDKEARFTALVHSIIRRGGRVLLPVFVLGRAQELLLLLDEYWSAHPELHSVPVYYVSSLAKRCIQVYQTYIHTMNDNIRSRFARRDNPFQFKHVSNLKGLDKFEDRGPCVLMCSPGLMQSGVSREVLERWAPDKRNGLIVSGYSVEGTMARTILTEPEEIISMSGQRIPRRMSVDYISFSAHVDFAQNAGFIDEVKAQHIVLVHGEQNAMSRLRAALQSKYSERAEDVKIHTPRNCDVLKLKFRGERMAKAIGSIAAKPPPPDTLLSGLIVSKDFVYTILDPSDLSEFTGLSTSVIVQRQRIALGVSWELVKWHLEGMYGGLKEGVDPDRVPTVRVMDVIDIKHTSEHQLTLEWVSSVANDMIADSVLALLLGIDRTPASVKMTTQPHTHLHSHPHATAATTTCADAHSTKSSSSPPAPANVRAERMLAFLEAHFGPAEECVLKVTPEGRIVEEQVGEEETAEGEGGVKMEDADEKTPEAAQAPALDDEKGPTDATETVKTNKNSDLVDHPGVRVRLDEQFALVDLVTFDVASTTSPAFASRVRKVVSLSLRTIRPLSEGWTVASSPDMDVLGLGDGDGDGEVSAKGEEGEGADRFVELPEAKRTKTVEGNEDGEGKSKADEGGKVVEDL